jgi:RNA polymerase sigma-70 factor (ECF subfamily)
MDRLLTDQACVSGRLLFTLAYKILRDVDAAEDACQQAFLKAWQHQGTLQSRESLRAWLAQTVVNESLGVYRRRQTEKRILRQQAQTATAVVQEVVDPGEQREEVLSHVSQLPEPIRTVVVLRLLEGLSGNEVKELLGCSAAEVSRRLHEGLDLLREKLRGRALTWGDG